MIKFLFTCFFSSLVFAQNIPVNIYIIADTIKHNSSPTALAKPKYGWKEFYEKIPYPINAYNNNIESSFDIELNIDSNGDVTSIKSYGNDDRKTFLGSIKEVIYSTKWEPATENGKKRKSNITIQMLYYIRRYNNPFPLVIEGNQAYMLKTNHFDSLNNSINSKADTLIKERDSIYYFNLNPKCCTEYSSPAPILGFDTLKSFVNNSLFKKYGIATTKLINLYFNESGEIDSVCYSTYFQALINNFAEELQRIKWLPAQKDNENIGSCLSLPIIYYFRDRKSVYPIILEAIKCGAL